MTAKTFPGTTTAYTLLGAAPGSKYSAVFRRKGEAGGNLASLDAGDPGLYVGGGGINRTFGIEMGAAAAGFTKVHQDALKAAKAGSFVTTGYDSHAPVRLVSTRLPGSAASAKAWPEETAFLDILAPAVVPHGEPSNYALLCVVPPDGRPTTRHYASDADFLAAVTRTAANAAALLADYNAVQIAAHPALGLAPIPVLRTCLLSGLAFKPDSVPGSDVAKAIFAGLGDALAAAGSAGGITLVEFENAGGEFSALP